CARDEDDYVYFYTVVYW
nr:immunoglobulin heavy chain junction region [Macaca mulatta]